MSQRIKVFFDGGCRPNPGNMETAVVAAGRTRLQRDLGYGTGEDAEWLALIEALRIAQSLETGDFVLLGDAAAVVGVANGLVKARGRAHQTFAGIPGAGGGKRSTAHPPHQAIAKSRRDSIGEIASSIDRLGGVDRSLAAARLARRVQTV